MAKRGAKSLLSLSTLLASFFGAAMIASAFAYFNYKFSEYKFINFHNWTFYTKNDIFKPTEDRYLIIFYSSKDRDSLKEIEKAKVKTKILAIDYYNKVEQSNTKITYLRSGTNNSLSFIQRFNIYKVPSVFFIKREKKSLYKQDSMIHKLENLRELSKVK